MTTRTRYCDTCRQVFDADDVPDTGVHYDGTDYNLPECRGEIVEVYICPVDDARIIDDGSMNHGNLIIPGADDE